MDKPTEWTYGGQLDWTSADTLKLAPTGMAIRCIVEALKERAEAANYTLPEIISSDWNPLNVPNEVKDAIQTAISALIEPVSLWTSSVNFYKHDVDITTYGYNDVPVNWNEASILSAIGATERLNPARLGLLREWVYQQYRILNLLRQVFARGQYPAGGTNLLCRQENQQYWQGFGYNQSEVNADWQQYVSWGAWFSARGKRTSGYDGVEWSAATNSATDYIIFNGSKSKFETLACEIKWYYLALEPFDAFYDGNQRLNSNRYYLHGTYGTRRLESEFRGSLDKSYRLQ